MAIYGISDLHLSLSADKPMDVFPGWDHYVDQLKSRWSALVTSDDTVVIPGDFSWALKLEDTEADFSFLETLPGKKILLKGNHDLWWSTMKKFRAFLNDRGFSTVTPLFNDAVSVGEYTVCGTRGWDYDAPETEKLVSLREAGRLERSLAEAEKLGGTPLVFLHFPPAYGSFVCREIMDVLHDHKVTTVYHGHIHGTGYLNCPTEIEGIRLELLSCDRLGFTPRRIVP